MSHLIAFLLVAGLIVITPGPDMTLVTSNAISGGRKAALLTAAGVNTGLVVWTIASAVGIAAALQASATVFLVVKLAGAAYLVILGMQSLIAAIRRQPTPIEPSHRVRAGSPFRQGLMTNLLNPKIAVLFTSLIPQFVSSGPTAALQSAAFSALFIAMGLVWLTALAMAASAAGNVLRRPRVQRTVRAVAGTALVAFGVRLAAEFS